MEVILDSTEETSMDRKTYMKNIYSKYWIYAREREYGFLEYDKNLCNYICKNVSEEGSILDVGVGTGFPFGDFFQKVMFLWRFFPLMTVDIIRCFFKVR